MTDLTDKWKERSTQEDKHYYIKDRNEKVYIDFYWGEGWLDTPDEDIKEVLAEVPSYEEWQAKLEENTKLKELLKECREVIKNVDTYYGNYDSTNGFLIVEKINQALGEDK